MDSNNFMNESVDAWLNGLEMDFAGLLSSNNDWAGISCGSAVLVGGQASKALADAKEMSQIKSDLDILAEKLVKSPANFVTTILGIAQAKTKWNPLQPDKAENEKNFYNYVDQVLRFPLMVCGKSEDTNVHYEYSNYDSLIDNISSLYDSATEKDKKGIKDSLVQLVQSCVSRENQINEKSMFSQSTITVDDVVKLTFYSSTVRMEKSKSGGGKSVPKESFRSDVSVRQVEIVFICSALNRELAKKVCTMLYKGVDDWLEANNTPLTDKKYEFCFG